MPRLMSVSLTEEAVREGRKTVTRRLGWAWLTPGTRLTLCRKVMGRKASEPIERIRDVEVVDVRRERLDEITADDVAAEGFPNLTPAAFVDFFTTHMDCTPSTVVTRIEWEYVGDPYPPAVLYDIDGIPMAVHGHLPPRKAYRILWDLDEDTFVDLMPDLVDSETCRLSLSVYRSIVEEFTHGWYLRSHRNPLDRRMDGDFGEDSYWPIPDEWPGAIPYTEVHFG